jgi:serine phosphatase RsbU (regulator of sigma subunit)
MRLNLQLLITFIVLFIVIAGFAGFIYVFDRYLYQEIKKQAIQDNQVIGEAVIKILEKQNNLFADNHNHPQLIQNFQSACDQIKLPNNGYLCVAKNDGELLAAPGMSKNKSKSKEKPTLNKAIYSDLERKRGFDFKQIEKGKVFSGYYEYPHKNYSDLVVGLPYKSDYRIFVHQNNHAIQSKARKHLIPMTALSAVISLICGLVIYFSLNFVVVRYERRINEKNEELNLAIEEILAQKENIEEQNKDLYDKQEEIKAQNLILHAQHTEILTQNTAINQSLKYAKNIQRAILAEQKLTSIFPESFVLYLPKDIVSGDFWWIGKLGNKNFIIVADCTGHGVPGAFMTMIGNILLDKIINVREISQPSAILESLNSEIKQVLRQKENSNIDGMDVAVCVLEDAASDRCEITFSGAKRPVYFIKKGDNVIQEIKGNRRSIGGNQSELETFTDHRFQLEKGSLLYLFTDGYPDQNDEKRKKLSEAKFQSLLVENQHNALQSQREHLSSFILDYMIYTKQRDDILVLGVKV